MSQEVFCVDCKVFVELKLFSKDHKRHEMKLKSDVLEENKKIFLEIKKKETKIEMNCVEEGDTKWQEIQSQAASLKKSLDDHSSKINTQIEQNMCDGFVIIDTELSEIAQNYMEFKNNFIESENKKLLNFERKIEKLNESTLREFRLVLPELPKTTPAYNTELKLVFNPASEKVIDSKHLPKIIPITTKNMVVATKVNPTKYTQGKSSSISSSPSTSTEILNVKNEQTEKPIEFSESSYNLCKDKCPYLVTQDRLNVYALFSRMKKIKIFSKKTKRIFKQVYFSFEPCRMLAMDSKLYIIDLKKKKLFISWKENKCEEKIEEIILNYSPNFLSVGANKKVTITSYKDVQSYDPSNASLKTLPGTSNIGGTLRCFDLGSMIMIISHNNGNNILMCIVDEKIVRKYHLKLNIFKKEYFIDVNQNGNVCVFNTMKNSIKILDSNFNTLGSVHVQQFENEQIKDISMDNKNVIYITSVQKDYICKVVKIPFLY